MKNKPVVAELAALDLIFPVGGFFHSPLGAALEVNVEGFESLQPKDEEQSFTLSIYHKDTI